MVLHKLIFLHKLMVLHKLIVLRKLIVLHKIKILIKRCKMFHLERVSLSCRTEMTVLPSVTIELKTNILKEYESFPQLKFSKLFILATYLI